MAPSIWTSMVTPAYLITTILAEAREQLCDIFYLQNISCCKKAGMERDTVELNLYVDMNVTTKGPLKMNSNGRNSLSGDMFLAG